MALTYRAIFRNCNYIHTLTKPVKWTIGRNLPIRILASSVCYQHNYQHVPSLGTKSVGILTLRQYTQNNAQKPPPETEEKKLGLIQRFKQMYRDYWYVLLPVHMATSAIWFGSLYYAVRSGVDVISLLESVGVSDKLLTPLRDSSAGYFALAFAFYKLITPLRYAVTVGGTTYAIKRLTTLGWIKPVPSRERIKEMLQEKKGNLQDRFQESKQHYQSQIQEKRTHMMDEMKRYKTEMRNMKNKVKKM